MTWTASITPDDAAQEGDGLVAQMLRAQRPTPTESTAPSPPMRLLSSPPDQLLPIDSINLAAAAAMEAPLPDRTDWRIPTEHGTYGFWGRAEAAEKSQLASDLTPHAPLLDSDGEPLRCHRCGAILLHRPAGQEPDPVPTTEPTPPAPDPLWLAMARALAGPRLCPAEPEDYTPAVRDLWAAVIEAVRDRIVPEEPMADLPEYPEDWEVACWASCNQRRGLRILLTEEARIAREVGRG